MPVRTGPGRTYACPHGSAQVLLTRPTPPFVRAANLCLSRSGAVPFRPPFYSHVRLRHSSVLLIYACPVPAAVPAVIYACPVAALLRRFRRDLCLSCCGARVPVPFRPLLIYACPVPARVPRREPAPSRSRPKTAAECESAGPRRVPLRRPVCPCRWLIQGAIEPLLEPERRFDRRAIQIPLLVAVTQ